MGNQPLSGGLSAIAWWIINTVPLSINPRCRPAEKAARGAGRAEIEDQYAVFVDARVGEFERFGNVDRVLGKQAIGAHHPRAVAVGFDHRVCVAHRCARRLEPDAAVRAVVKQVDRLGRAHPLVCHAVENDAALSVQRHVDAGQPRHHVAARYLSPISFHKTNISSRLMIVS